MPEAVALLVEERGGGAAESSGHLFLSVAVTLTLGILGSSVLPVPYAFSRTGVLCGLGVATTVAAANSLTGTLLLRAAGHLGSRSFEGLAEAVGGRSWKAVTQASLVLLLFGTLAGDFCLLADQSKRALEELLPAGSTPLRWLTAGDGRLAMCALAWGVVFPLSMLRRMRQLEYAAMAGVGLVLVLAGVVVQSALAAGLPAIASGELPLLRLAAPAELPEAVAVLSFAYYLTPMLLPMLREMPAGRLGVELTARATQLVTMVVASAVYGVVGVFAAARYGLATQGDVLTNAWLPGRWQGVLNGLMALYLSLSMAPMCMTLRIQLDGLVAGEAAAYLWGRELALTLAALGSALAVALAWPTAAEKMFAVTGATAVCVVCYLLPVAIHLRLYYRSSSATKHQAAAAAPTAAAAAARRSAAAAGRPAVREPLLSGARSQPQPMAGGGRLWGDFSLSGWLRPSAGGSSVGTAPAAAPVPFGSVAFGSYAQCESPTSPVGWHAGAGEPLPPSHAFAPAAGTEDSAVLLAGGRGSECEAGAASLEEEEEEAEGPPWVAAEAAQACPYPSARDVAGRGLSGRLAAAAQHVWLPLAVAALGAVSSLLALWLAVASAFDRRRR